MRLTIDFLESTDENVRQLIDTLRYGLSVAQEAELVSPDFATEINGWMRAERARMQGRTPSPRDREPDRLRESRWFEFWSTLKPEQEVRWTQTLASTYFVVTGDLVHEHPETRYRTSAGPFVQLRRHTGKTFWCHIAQVRPLGWVKGASQ